MARPSIVEIAVNPGWELADELVLAIALSAPWPGSYFSTPATSKNREFRRP